MFSKLNPCTRGNAISGLAVSAGQMGFFAKEPDENAQTVCIGPSLKRRVLLEDLHNPNEYIARVWAAAEKAELRWPGVTEGESGALAKSATAALAESAAEEVLCFCQGFRAFLEQVRGSCCASALQLCVRGYHRRLLLLY